MSVKIYNINVGIGDCILITSKSSNIMVDCGKYNQNVKDTLNENNIKSIDLLIVTHIDDDHIKGVIDLLEEVTVKQILFNGFHHIPLPDSTKELYQISEAKYCSLSAFKSYFNLPLRTENTINARQSLSLSEVIKNKEVPWNSIINHERLSTENKKDIVIGDVKLTLLSPGDSELVKTYKEYQEFICEKLGYVLESDKKEDISRSLYDMAQSERIIYCDEYSISAYATLTKASIEDYAEKSRELDSSNSNKASLAFVIEIENKKILILGDAHPTIVSKSIRYINSNKPMIFDAIKVSHHGSCKNTDNDLLSLIDSSKYIFCGGTNKRPDEFTISKIIIRHIENDIGFKQRELFFNAENKVIANFKTHNQLQTELSFKIITENTPILL